MSLSDNVDMGELMIKRAEIAEKINDGIEELSIEFEGKEPTPLRMKEIIDYAKRSGLKTVFVQRQYDARCRFHGQSQCRPLHFRSRGQWLWLKQCTV